MRTLRHYAVVYLKLLGVILVFCAALAGFALPLRIAAETGDEAWLLVWVPLLALYLTAVQVMIDRDHRRRYR